MEKYTRYLRDCTNIPEDLYYDLFASMCDADMQKKLENIKGITKMSQSEHTQALRLIFYVCEHNLILNITLVVTKLCHIRQV